MEKNYITLNWVNFITIMVIVIVGHAVIAAATTFGLKHFGSRAQKEGEALA